MNATQARKMMTRMGEGATDLRALLRHLDTTYPEGQRVPLAVLDDLEDAINEINGAAASLYELLNTYQSRI